MATGVNRGFDILTGPGFVYGRSEAILPVNSMVGEISRTDIPVLVEGESGTGKDVYARLIHQLSAVRELPLVKLNCTVLEPGELLSRVKTSLAANWAGEAQESAGTLYLDGIDELDLDCQRVLLAMLQEREMSSGGAMGFRLICTATKNLDREIGLGRFRRELYFRINGACVKLPALRHRKEDVTALMEYFLEKHAAEVGKRIPILSADEEELLRSYDWPGNIRELAKEASRLAERDLILRALERTHWNRKRAARELQVSYKALLYKIKQMDVDGAQIKRLQGDE